MAEIINNATNALYGFFVPTSDRILLAIETVAPLLSIYFARIEPNKKIAKFDAINPANEVIYEFSFPNRVETSGVSLKSKTTKVAIGAATIILNFFTIKNMIVAIPNIIPMIPNISMKTPQFFVDINVSKVVIIIFLKCKNNTKIEPKVIFVGE